MSAITLGFLHRARRNGAIEQAITIKPENPFKDMEGVETFSIPLVRRTAAHQVLERVLEATEKGEPIAGQLLKDIVFVVRGNDRTL